MKLRNKVSFAILVVSLIYFGLTYVVANSVLLNSFLKLENKQTERDMLRVNQAVGQVLYALGTFTADWAQWNEAYEYILGKNPAFVPRNLVMTAFTNSNLNYVGYFNKQGQPSIEITVDFENKKFVPFYEGLKQYLTSNSLLVHRTDLNHDLQGFILLPSGIMLVAASAISTTDKTAPIAGTLITGRFISKNLLVKIAETTKLDIALFLPAEIQNNQLLSQAYNSLLTNKTNTLPVILNKNTIYGYILLRDINDKPIGMLRISSPRAIYTTGIQAISYFLVTNLSLAFILTLVLWWLLRNFLLKRIERLNKQIEDIGSNSKLTNRVDAIGNDELTSVALKINNMLEVIQASHDKLEFRVTERTHELQQANIKLTQEISERKVIERELIVNKEHLAYLAHYDNLTGLANRALFNDTLNKALSNAKRHNKKLAILFIDLDRFKNFNDALGHHFGDEILVATAKRIASLLRNEDFIARLGGDEFIILIKDIGNEYADVVPIIEKILKVCSQSLNIKDREVYITCSIGASIFPKDGANLEDLQKAADAAMYTAKKAGGNTFHFFTPDLNKKAQQTIEYEVDLRKAIANNDFRIYYQPKIDLRTNAIIGAEALIRWFHPIYGLMMPQDFISIAEASNLIVDIGEWMLKQACFDIKKWHAQISTRVNISINLSPVQFTHINLISNIKSIIQETQIDPKYLEFEITENIMMENMELAVTKLNEIKALGFNISIDDFGTGYSCITYLKHLPINILKIDRTFIKDIPNNYDNATITSAVITLGHELGLKVIAEGVENREQINYLVENNCDYAQGYYFGIPVPADVFFDQLKTQQEEYK